MADVPANTGSGLAPGKEISIDRDACMGSGNCLHWAPEVFDLDDDGIAVVHGALAGHEDQVRQAVANCPTWAIRIEDVLSAEA
jgi:ferredoxin